MSLQSSNVRTTLSYFSITLMAFALFVLPAPSSLAEEYEIDEIIVTATGRQAGSQTVPISVTAITELELERNGVTDLKNLISFVPSLNMNSTNTETGGSTLRLRGVGTTGNNAGLEGSVGVFVDGVYLSRPGMAFSDLVDIERIEVLRGPQGTLFGRNTSAGAVDIKTRKPDLSEPESRLNLSYGNYDDVVVNGIMNFPVVEDSLGLRLSGSYHNRKGLLRSVVDSGSRSNDRERFLIRGQALYEPIEDLSIRLIGDYFEANEKCCDSPIRFESGSIPLAFAGFGAAVGLTSGNGIDSNFGKSALEDRKTNANRERDNDQDQWGLSVELNWDADFGKLTYIGSYRDWNSSQAGDDDFTSYDILATQSSPNNVELTTHEVRLSGDWEWLDWLVGGFFSYEEIRATGHLGLGSDYEAYANLLSLAGTVTAPGGPFGIGTFTGLGAGANFPTLGGEPTVIGDNRFAQDGTAWALFTHNIIDVGELAGFTEDLVELTGGLRYNWETKDGSFVKGGTANPGCEGLVAQSRLGGGLDFGGPAGDLDVLAGLICFPFVSPFVPEFDQNFKDNQLTGTAALSLDFAEFVDFLDTGMAYVSYSRGFKSGGFNLDSTAAIVNGMGTATIPDNPADDALPGNFLEVGDASFDSEIVDAFEVGFKTDLLDRRLRFNMTYFHYDIDDLQVLEFTGIQFVTENVAKVTVDGVEIELLGRPVDDLELQSSIIYSDARYGSGGCTLSTEGPTLADQVCGEQLTNAPKWVINLGGNYSHRLFSASALHLPSFVSTGDILGSLALNYQWKDKRRAGTTPAGATETPKARMQSDSFSLNLRGAILADDYRWALEFWGRNITDERTSAIRFAIPLRDGATGSFIDEPRTFGFTFRATL